MTKLGMNVFNMPPAESVVGSMFFARRDSMDSARPFDQSFFSADCLFSVHIVSLRFLMFSKIPVVVQYIIPMTLGSASPPFFMSFAWFALFCEILKKGLATLVPPLPRYC